VQENVRAVEDSMEEFLKKKCANSQSEEVKVRTTASTAQESIPWQNRTQVVKNIIGVKRASLQWHVQDLKQGGAKPIAREARAQKFKPRPPKR
jgi:hypothetical protein